MNKHSGNFYKKTAEKNGLRTRNGRGDHVIVYSKDEKSCIAIPLHSDLAKGTECAIKKWFIRIGIIVIMITAWWYLF
jgi:hypothetical protein